MIAALIGGAVGAAVDLVAPWASVAGLAGLAAGGLGLVVGGPARRTLLALAAAAIVATLLVQAAGMARETARAATAERDAARRVLQEAERVNRANLAALDQLRRRHDADLSALAAALDRTRAADRRVARAREEIARDPDANHAVAPAVARYLDRLRAAAAGGDASDGDPDGTAAPAARPDALRGRADAAAGADRSGEPSRVDRGGAAGGR